MEAQVSTASVSAGKWTPASAAGAIAALLARGDELFVAPQVLIEFWSVATRPADVNGLGWSVEVVRGEIDSILGQFPVLPDMPAVFEEWLRLVTEHRVTGKKVPVEYGPRRPGDPASLYANAKKIRDELGWQAKHTEIDGIVATAWNWFKNHPHGYGK